MTNNKFLIAAVTGLVGFVVGSVGTSLFKNSGEGLATLATETDQGNTVELSTAKHKQSYSFGFAIGSQIQPTLEFNKERIDYDIFMMGFKDKITDANLKISEKEINENLQQLQKMATSVINTEIEGKALANQKDLFVAANNPQLGQGDITIVEFFDYNCPHCRTLNTRLTKLVSATDNLKVIYRPVGIVSKTSQIATLAVLAANKQNKFKEVHTALMSHEGEITKDIVDKVILEASLDKVQFESDVKSSEIMSQAKNNTKMFMTLGLRGVPSLFAARLGSDNQVKNKKLVLLSIETDEIIKSALSKL